MTGLEVLKELIDEMANDDGDIDSQIAKAELRLKQLRALKSTLGLGTKPKPRAKAKGGDKSA